MSDQTRGEKFVEMLGSYLAHCENVAHWHKVGISGIGMEPLVRSRDNAAAALAREVDAIWEAVDELKERRWPPMAGRRER